MYAQIISIVLIVVESSTFWKDLHNRLCVHFVMCLFVILVIPLLLFWEQVFVYDYTSSCSLLTFWLSVCFGLQPSKLWQLSQSPNLIAYEAVLVSEFRWCFTLCLFIILLVRSGLLSDHLLGNSCPLGKPFVFGVSCLFVILVISHLGFEGGICNMIALVPVHCFLITFTLHSQGTDNCSAYRMD